MNTSFFLGLKKLIMEYTIGEEELGSDCCCCDFDDYQDNEDNLDNEYYEDGLSIEEKMELFTSWYPYPTLEDMEEKLEHHLELEAEYGEKNHAWCERLYYGILDEDIIYEVGKEIYEWGGTRAMAANYETLVGFSPFWESVDEDVRPYCRRIQIFWEGIGDWKY